MGHQIVNERKKGRPSKSDLARRPAAEARDVRRRSFRYDVDDDVYEEEEEEMKREKKKRLKLPLNGEGHAPFSLENEGEDDKDVVDDDDADEERGRNDDSEEIHSFPGTPLEPASGIPLPHKKTLDLVLHKLQKKDTYGVYAEPVDPEELPDYHDTIKHPMDFATVRKKMSNGSYLTLEQFESDIFLICSNAMKYNAPETIYHRQARSMLELARKKFQRLRIEHERSENELKFEQKTIPNMQIKKPFSRASQELSGASLASLRDIQNGVNTASVACENPNNDVVEGNSYLVDNSFEKVEELLSGNRFPSKFGKKPFVVYENRRATYGIPNQPVVSSEPIFSIFEGEKKHLVPVGLHAEYSYSRSLAHFAATLGPVAWNVASKKIEKVLPAGFRFGRGWVGEYEPQPTAVLMLANRAKRGTESITSFPCTADMRKEDKASMDSSHDNASTGHPCSVNPSFPVATVRDSSRQQNTGSRNVVEPKDVVLNQTYLDSPHSTIQNMTDQVARKQQFSYDLQIESVLRGSNLLQSASFNQPVMSNSVNNSKMYNLPSDSVPNQIPTTDCPQNPGFRNGAMKMLAENARKQQILPNQHSIVGTTPVIRSAPSSRRDDHGNGATVTDAPAWISIASGGGYRTKVETPSTTDRNQISADSLHNPTREFHNQAMWTLGEYPISRGMQLHPQKNGLPFQAFVQQSTQMSNGVQFPNLVSANLLGFQAQSPFRGFDTHNNQHRPKQETRPPDLNIGFQPSGSPVRQSLGVSGILVESQHPDLALQL